MATLYITEYAGLGNGSNDTVQAVAGPPVAEQTVAVGAQAQSAAFNASTTIVRLHTDVICSVLVGGLNPIATTAKSRMAANQTEYYRVQPGDKLSVIANT